MRRTNIDIRKTKKERIAKIASCFVGGVLLFVTKKENKSMLTKHSLGPFLPFLHPCHPVLDAGSPIVKATLCQVEMADQVCYDRIGKGAFHLFSLVVPISLKKQANR